MTFEAVSLIKDEHWAMSAVLLSLTSLVRGMRQRIADAKDPEADFDLLKAMLDYIVSYPDRWHHPKEEDVLFPAVRRNTREADVLLAELERDHEEGQRSIARLQSALLDFRAGAPGAAATFFDAVDRYARFQWEHIGKEERCLLPVAQRVLSEADWRDIAAAFERKDNPPFGIQPRADADALFHRILNLAPAPMGFGPSRAR